MRKLAAVLALLAVLGMATAQTQVRWFVGLGAGSDAPNLAPQQAVVDAFNASQNNVRLVLEIVDNAVAQDILATQIAAGNAPDIVGPVGILGLSQFPGAWRDVSDLIAATDYDLSDFEPANVDLYALEGVGQIGLPFGVFPSYITYNVELFDEAGLPHPPSRYGEPYVTADGRELPWNLDTVRDLAMLLTVDANGSDASMPGFDPNNVVQWGFMHQWTDLRGMLAMFGAGNFVDADGNAVIPEHWVAGAQWLYDAMWKDYFYPHAAYMNSALIGSTFQSGNVAMAHTHLWFQGCCLFDLRDTWALAPMPAAADGTITAKLHGDMFGITAASRNPEAAFEALTYLLSPDVMLQLANTYGAMPARLSLQDDYLAGFFTERYPDRDIDFTIVIDSLAYPDSPNHEAGMPNFLEARALYNALFERLNNSGSLDVVAELNTFRSELQLLFDTAR